MVSSLWPCHCSIVTVTVISVAVSVAFIVAVIIDRCRRCRLHCRRLLCPSWRRSNGGGAAMAMAAQQRRWVDVVPVNGNGVPPPLPYDDCAPPVPPSPRSGSRPRCRPPPPVLHHDHRHSRLPPLPSPPSLFDCCVDLPEAGGSNAAIALLPPGMRLTIIFCLLLFSMSFVDNFATSIASCTVRLGAFRRVFTAILNLASSAALFFDMWATSVY
jgi:hypothetical protein